ncbi:hypothetical protein B0H17DRAFT_1076341 [Mycena rosella]|uniref:Uncharacterized protein n=1 Tax=Mycena rosella TaxID=1033263 RepID=A0AAD7D6G1_MYCRO|nr:hypothetical protein B0H17DRAFT_1076341 [Mycena rosella]
MKEPPLPYRRRTVHWTAAFGTIRPPGRTVTIPKARAWASPRKPGASPGFQAKPGPGHH